MVASRSPLIRHKQPGPAARLPVRVGDVLQQPVLEGPPGVPPQGRRRRRRRVLRLWRRRPQSTCLGGSAIVSRGCWLRVVMLSGAAEAGELVA